MYIYIFLLFWFEEDNVIQIYNHDKKKMVSLSTQELPVLLPKQLLLTIRSSASSLYLLPSHFPDRKLELNSCETEE